MTRLPVLLLMVSLAACGGGPDDVAPGGPQPGGYGSFTRTKALFALSEDETFTRESLMVVGGERTAVVAALQAAGERWFYVTEDGDDLSGLAPDVDALAEAAGERYTPNYVFDVHLGPRGPALRVDCKGFVSPPMARTFVRIVEEELRRRGVTSAVFDDAGPYTGDEEILTPGS